MRSGVRGLYRTVGYFNVSVGEPIIEKHDTTHSRLGSSLGTGKGHGKAVMSPYQSKRASATAWALSNRKFDPDKAGPQRLML